MYDSPAEYRCGVERLPHCECPGLSIHFVHHMLEGHPGLSVILLIAWPWLYFVMLAFFPVFGKGMVAILWFAPLVWFVFGVPALELVRLLLRAIVRWALAGQDTHSNGQG